jgi:hypothetical protein
MKGENSGTYKLLPPVEGKGNRNLKLTLLKRLFIGFTEKPEEHPSQDNKEDLYNRNSDNPFFWKKFLNSLGNYWNTSHSNNSQQKDLNLRIISRKEYPAWIEDFITDVYGVYGTKNDFKKINIIDKWGHKTSLWKNNDRLSRLFGIRNKLEALPKEKLLAHKNLFLRIDNEILKLLGIKIKEERTQIEQEYDQDVLKERTLINFNKILKEKS